MNNDKVPFDWTTWHDTYSSLSRLQRVLAYVLRFCRLKKITVVDRNKFLRATELRTSLHILIRQAQSVHFKEEIARINKGIPPQSLQKLLPFVGDLGLLRVGGRLKFANLPYDSRHPVILPKTAHITRVLVEYYHKMYLHAGTRTLKALLFQSFWIISSHNVIRACISRCLVCHKFTASTIQPQMGNLPTFRLTPGRPFSNVGIDFAGPFTIKESTRRNARTYKSYFCIFI